MFTMILTLVLFSLTTTLILAKSDVLKKIDGHIPSSQNVEYECIFENLFSEERHPNNLPLNSNMVHWTRSVIASHGNLYNMWKEGELASPAVKKMAESGGNDEIIKELEYRQSSYKVGYDKFLYATDQTIVYKKLKVDSFRRFISAISKLAPSPDWFSGFHDFNCVNEDTNTWYKEFVIAVYPYDAGTEEGDGFDVVNQPTSPAQPIKQFTVDNIPQTTKVFLNKEGTDILPVGTYNCTVFDQEEDGGRGPTQSPIFTKLTQRPTGPTQSPVLPTQSPVFTESTRTPTGLRAPTATGNITSQKNQVQENGSSNNGFIAGLIVGSVSTIFIVSGILIFAYLYYKGKDEDDDETNNGAVIRVRLSKLEQLKEQLHRKSKGSIVDEDDFIGSIKKIEEKHMLFEQRKSILSLGETLKTV